MTLAANFSSFIQRCQSVNETSKYPGNGLPVMPPERSHSLNASKQFFQGDRLHIGLPSIVYDTYNTLSLGAIDMDFVPLDSTLQQLFSSIGARRDSVHKLGKRMSPWKLWRGTKSPDPGLPERERRVSFRDYSGLQGFGNGSRWSSFSSAASQGRKWFSPRAPFNGHRRGIRGLMGGHDGLQGHTRGNSTASDPLGYYL